MMIFQEHQLHAAMGAAPSTSEIPKNEKTKSGGFNNRTSHTTGYNGKNINKANNATEAQKQAALAMQIFTWLREDTERMHALKTAETLKLPDWCIGAGFIRNLVWDKLFETCAHPLNDIDVIYYDRQNLTPDRDRDYEAQLKEKQQYPWSVKNQARMHTRNGDKPYTSTLNALSFWMEIETAIGVRLANGQLELLAPFGLNDLMSGTITFNSKRANPEIFRQRITQKGWLQLWPGLRVKDSGS